MLHLTQARFEQIRGEAELAYPEEGCGILLGVEGSRQIERAIPVRNTSASPRRHYEIDLAELIQVQREGRLAGLEILGFYHSHPDHPAAPSETDLAEAHWLGCWYLITAVDAGCATETRAYQLDGEREEDKHFVEQQVQAAPGL